MRNLVVNQRDSSERVLVVHRHQDSGAVVEGIRNAAVDDQASVEHPRPHQQRIREPVLGILRPTSVQQRGKEKVERGKVRKRNREVEKGRKMRGKGREAEEEEEEREEEQGKRGRKK